MGNKVTFDYSKASCFISDAEVQSMKKNRDGCKRTARIKVRSGK